MKQQQKQQGRRAIIIGGSIAGLLAARVLSEQLDEVVIIEKDKLNDKAEPRRGVPQSSQLHSIHQKGAEIIQELFPDMGWDYESCGVVPCDLGSDMRWFFYGKWMKQKQSDVFVHWCERPLLEWQIRRRVLARPNVTLIDGCKVSGLIHDQANQRILGVITRSAKRPRQDLLLHADFVVDAGGRGSRITKWLSALGFAVPPQSEVKINLGYASGYFELPEGVNPPWKALLISAKPGLSQRLGLIHKMPNNRLKLLLAGWFGDHPPTDEAGFLAFARELPQPDLYNFLQQAKLIAPIRAYKLPSNKWHHFEKVDNWPGGLFVVGDAVCSFNPSFGQGMTVAALQAVALGSHIAKPRRQSQAATQPSVARRFQKEAARLVNNPWMITTGEDLRFSEAEGPRPWSLPLLQKYLAQLFELTHENPKIAQQFFKVMTFMKEPPALFAPFVVGSVLRHVATKLVGKLGSRLPRTVQTPAPVKIRQS